MTYKKKITLQVKLKLLWWNLVNSCIRRYLARFNRRTMRYSKQNDEGFTCIIFNIDI